MFDQKLEDITPTVFIENGAWRLFDNLGLGNCGLIAGNTRISYRQAIKIISEFDHVIDTCPKRHRKLVRSYRNSIIDAFGCEMAKIIPHRKD